MVARALASAAALAGSLSNSPGSARAASIAAISRRAAGRSRFGLGDAAAQGRELDALFGGGRRRSGAAGTPAVPIAARSFSPACPALAEHELSIVVEVAVERRDLAVGDQPQPVGAGLDQVAIVRHQDHRARIVVDRLDQRRAAVDVEMIGRLVEHHEMRPAEGRKPEQQPRLFAAGKLAGRRVGERFAENPMAPARARTLASGASGISRRRWP